MKKKRKILFACHRHPFADNPRGGEKSVSIIMRYLSKKGYEVKGWIPYNGQHSECEEFGEIEVYNGLPLSHLVGRSDFVLTWGRVAVSAARACAEQHVPYLLMVRWWRNVVDVTHPIGDLMARQPDPLFTTSRLAMFRDAVAVVTNNHYAADVIESYYGVKAIVSYVPIEGQAARNCDPNGYLTVITPDKGLGEESVIWDLSGQMQQEKILVVNCPPALWPDFEKRNNITPIGYVRNMKQEVYKKTKILIMPAYNDICGTTRVVIEAYKNGIPVIANDRCGIGEKVKTLVPRDANWRDWCGAVTKINRDYDRYSREAIEVFEQYDTPGQLQIFEDIIKKYVQ